MIKTIFRHTTRQIIRDALYKKNTVKANKTLKAFNKLCKLDNLIRWFI